MALQTTAIITSIAGYTVTGVTIRDADAMYDEVKRRDTPLLMLAPGWFGSIKYKYDAFGTGAVAPLTMTYILGWRFFFKETGVERGLKDIAQGFTQKVTAIIDAVIAADATSDAIHLQVVRVSKIDTVLDPVGNSFWGCDIDIEITEFIN